MRKDWTQRFVLSILKLIMLAWIKSYFIGFFFHPDKEIISAPHYHQISHDDFFFFAKNGRRLHGYFLKAKRPAMGTLVHCHGNKGNISQHFSELLFLCEAGYNLMMFDYQGFGESEGRPSPVAIVQDAIAALDYVKSRPDVDKNRIGLFGQSLGGAAASEAMAKDPTIRCLLLEGTFTTYREMAWETLLGKIFFLVTLFLIPPRGPLKFISHVAPRPVLIIHGDSDGRVPVKFAYRLYEKARDKKSLLIIKGFHHLQGREGREPEYERKILEFLKANLIQ